MAVEAADDEAAASAEVSAEDGPIAPLVSTPAQSSRMASRRCSAIACRWLGTPTSIAIAPKAPRERFIMNTQRFTPKGEPSVNTGYSRGNDDERTVTNRELSACGSA